MPHDMKPEDFAVRGRPRLAEITEFPAMEFADYERRLTSLQGVLQLIQQAYLSTEDRALIALEGWDTAGKGGIVRRLGWALDPRSFKVHNRRARRTRTRPALSPALLVPLASQKTNHRLRPVLVWPSARRARRRHRKREGMAACIPRDQRVRAHADRLRHPAREAVPAYHA